MLLYINNINFLDNVHIREYRFDINLSTINILMSHLRK